MPKGTLKETLELRTERETALAKVFEEAKSEDGNLDFTKVECLGDDVKGNSVAVAEKVRGMNDELTEIAKDIEVLEAGDAAHKSQVERMKANRTVPHAGSSKGGGERIERPKSFGEQITEHKTFEDWLSGNKSNPIELPDVGIAEFKTTFQTGLDQGAGWDPETTRTGLLVEKRTRPLQVLDIIPLGQTGQAAVVYMEEATRVHSAVEMLEAGSYAVDQYALTERSSRVRKIGTSIPVTDEQLEDVPMVQAYLNQRLGFGVRQRLDSQVLVGSSGGANLVGILTTGNVQVQAKGSDPTPDAIYKAMTKVRVTGRAMPNVVVFHPNDWQDIRLLRTIDGVYIWGSPSDSGPERIWGLPILQTDAETEHTGLVGDFANFCMLFERRGLEIKLGLDDGDFLKGIQTMRADMRVAFVVFRPEAFCMVTGI